MNNLYLTFLELETENPIPAGGLEGTPASNTIFFSRYPPFSSLRVQLPQSFPSGFGICLKAESPVVHTGLKLAMQVSLALHT